MTNKELANKFNGLAKIMELYGENQFKIRSYSSAYINIRKQPEPLFEKSKEELLQIQGIGQAIADKIVELRETGEMKTLNKYLEKTPPGIVELMQVKGFGPKKVKAVWDELGIESPGELLYACHENRLVDLKGFGTKTQESLIQQLTYFLDSQGKYLYCHIIDESLELLQLLRTKFDKGRFDFTRGLQRKLPIVDGIEILTDVAIKEIDSWLSTLSNIELVEGHYYFKGSKIILYTVEADLYTDQLFLNSGSEEFITSWNSQFSIPNGGGSAASSFKELNIAFIPPESREYASIIPKAKSLPDLNLIEYADIKGVVHAHSTYSDGANTLADMAAASMQAGYQYLAISDHSKAAFYANGLTEDRVLMQISEIDKLNLENPAFRIFKGIECDILYDGQLDYEDDFLRVFDLVIASVHSNLKMDEDKATARLLKAIEHRATTILGHPTGRLLLSREGYPIDHRKIIDACAENRVAIEINASPYRLDLDWKWINYARDKGVLLSINPDAHSTAGIKDIRFGVDVARKSGLTPSECLNTTDIAGFEQWIKR